MLTPLDFGFIGYAYYISDDRDLVSALNKPSPSDCWRILGKEPVPPKTELFYVWARYEKSKPISYYVGSQDEAQAYIDAEATWDNQRLLKEYKNPNWTRPDWIPMYWGYDPIPLCHDEEELA